MIECWEAVRCLPIVGEIEGELTDIGKVNEAILKTPNPSASRLLQKAMTESPLGTYEYGLRAGRGSAGGELVTSGTASSTYACRDGCISAIYLKIQGAVSAFRGSSTSAELA